MTKKAKPHPEPEPAFVVEDVPLPPSVQALKDDIVEVTERLSDIVARLKAFHARLD